MKKKRQPKWKKRKEKRTFQDKTIVFGARRPFCAISLLYNFEKMPSRQLFGFMEITRSQLSWHVAFKSVSLPSIHFVEMSSGRNNWCDNLCLLQFYCGRVWSADFIIHDAVLTRPSLLLRAAFHRRRRRRRHRRRWCYSSQSSLLTAFTDYLFHCRR